MTAQRTLWTVRLLDDIQNFPKSLVSLTPMLQERTPTQENPRFSDPTQPYLVPGVFSIPLYAVSHKGIDEVVPKLVDGTDNTMRHGMAWELMVWMTSESVGIADTAILCGQGVPPQSSRGTFPELPRVD